MIVIVGDIRIDWLSGGVFELDGGTMFGVVPRVLWQKKLPPVQDNYIKFRNSPMLIRTPTANLIIETGLGNKLSEKQRKIYRVSEDWLLPGSLASLGLGRDDIDHVILTHCDFDHAGGVVMKGEGGELELTFPRARHLVNSIEWEDAMNPNVRSASTYLSENLSLLNNSGNLDLVEDGHEVVDGISLIHTGGHTRGHQVVRIESGGQVAWHLGDLLPSHAHSNPLWVMAYDNYPMDVIDRKARFLARAASEDAWLLLYHDMKYLACKFGEKGVVTEAVEA
jgi:glyoxylase-like metal-dependent hydrolase (beta-lactamase superfamily II)